MSDLISRQEAIEALLDEGQRSKRYRLGDIWELNFDEIREAIATVPSAEPEKRTEERTETRACDLISRQAAIDAIKTWGLLDGLSEGQAIEILADAEKLPPAEPERKTGQWYDVGSLSCRCSKCGCKSQKESLFCPNCGAKMEDEVSDDFK